MCIDAYGPKGCASRLCYWKQWLYWRYKTPGKEIKRISKIFDKHAIAQITWALLCNEIKLAYTKVFKTTCLVKMSLHKN